MSLTDALLLDPAPFELWISTRSDAKGCGTISDPFNGSTQARFDAVMQEIATQYAGQNVVIHLHNNVYELYPADPNSASPPIGISMFGLREIDVPPYIFREFVYRENVVRHLNGIPSSIGNYGINVTTVGTGIVEGNIVDTGHPSPLDFRIHGSINLLQNRRPNGALLHGSNSDVPSEIKQLDDLETRIQDAITIALL